MDKRSEHPSKMEKWRFLFREYHLHKLRHERTDFFNTHTHTRTRTPTSTLAGCRNSHWGNSSPGRRRHLARRISLVESEEAYLTL